MVIPCNSNTRGIIILCLYVSVSRSHVRVQCDLGLYDFTGINACDYLRHVVVSV